MWFITEQPQLKKAKIIQIDIYYDDGVIETIVAKNDTEMTREIYQ